MTSPLLDIIYLPIFLHSNQKNFYLSDGAAQRKMGAIMEIMVVVLISIR
jgi:hypothetical protein